MKKLFYIFLFVCFLASISFSQKVHNSYALVVQEIQKDIKILENKVSIGSSVDEVRKILGKPKAIEGGFPNEDFYIIPSLPEQVGQMNYSTWVYLFPIKSITYTVPAKDVYILNNEEVSDSLYYQYLEKDSIYYLNGKIIEKSEGDWIKEKGQELYDVRHGNFKIRKRDSETTYIKTIKAHKSKLSFTPSLCVIFDKGTQSVANLKAYYISHE